MSDDKKPQNPKKKKQVDDPSPPEQEDLSTKPLDRYWKKSLKNPPPISEAPTKVMRPFRPGDGLPGASEAKTKDLRRPGIMNPDEEDTKILDKKDFITDASEDVQWISEEPEEEFDYTLGRIWENGEEIEGLYRIDSILAQGGMGVVYKATDLATNRSLVIKSPLASLARNREMKQSFVREAEEWVRIGVHPNIVRAHTIHEVDYLPRIVAEFIEGKTLHGLIKHGLIDMKQALTIAIHISWGMVFAHSRGLAHRDLKPLNVMVTPDGVAKITDFGLVKRLSDTEEDSMPLGMPASEDVRVRLPLESTISGTPEYAAPEQWSGQGDMGSDIYAFGILLYELFCGRRPFEYGHLEESEKMDALEHAHCHLPPPKPMELNADIPVRLSDMMESCMAKDPLQRPKHFRDIVTTLRDIRQDRFEDPGPDEPAQEKITAAQKLDQAWAFLRLGMGCIFRGDYSKGSSLYQEAYQVFEAEQDLAGMRSTLREKGKFGSIKGDYDESIDNLQRCLDLEKKLNDPQSLIDSMCVLGSVYRRRGELDISLKIFQDALALAEAESYQHGIGKLLEWIGSVYLYRSEFKIAIEYLERSKEVCEELNEVHSIARSYLTMGLVYLRKGDHEVAIEYFHQAQACARTLGDVNMISTSYLNLSVCYRHIGNPDLSDEQLHKCLKIVEPAGIKTNISYCYNNLAYSNMCRGLYNKALPLLEKSLEIKKDIGDQLGLVTSLANIGMIHMTKGDLKKAESLFDQVLEMGISRNVNDETLMARMYLSDLYIIKGQIDEARKQVILSTDLARSMDEPNRLGKALDVQYYLARITDDTVLAQSTYDNMQEILADISSSVSRCSVIMNLALHQILQGETAAAKTWIDESQNTCDKLQVISGTYWLNRCQSVYYISIGEIESAKDYLKKTIAIADQLESKHMAGEAYYEFATMCQRFGHDELPLPYFEKAEKSFQGTTHLWATASSNWIKTLRLP